MTVLVSHVDHTCIDSSAVPRYDLAHDRLERCGAKRVVRAEPHPKPFLYKPSVQYLHVAFDSRCDRKLELPQ